MFKARIFRSRVKRRGIVVLGAVAVLAVGGLQATSASAMPTSCVGKPANTIYTALDANRKPIGQQTCAIWYDGSGKVKSYADPKNGIRAAAKTGPAKPVAKPKAVAPVKKAAPVAQRPKNVAASGIKIPTITPPPVPIPKRATPVRAPIPRAVEGAMCSQGSQPQGDLYCAANQKWTGITWLQKVTGNDEVAKYWQKHGKPDPRVAANPKG